MGAILGRFLSRGRGVRISRLSDARSFLRFGRLLTVVLSLVVVCYGCKDYPRLVKEGAFFAAPDRPPSGKALVYIYWPGERQDRRNHLWVGPCKGLSDEILPGSYTTFDVEPGPRCFEAEVRSELIHNRASVSRPLGSVELTAAPGQTFFVRIEPERALLISRAILRRVNPDVANPEIKMCRRVIPLTSDELVQQYFGEDMRRGRR
jgi:hypothetical protein